jgi:hypothetical protein
LIGPLFFTTIFKKFPPLWYVTFTKNIKIQCVVGLPLEGDLNGNVDDGKLPALQYNQKVLKPRGYKPNNALKEGKTGNE